MVSNKSISPKMLPWIVWILGCIFYFYEFLLQVSPGVMSNELMHAFGITSERLGILVGFYFYSYAFMQLPGGVLLDYFGPHRLLTLATTLCAVSTIIFGLTHSFWMGALARLLIGFGSAFAAVGTMKLASNWFAPERFAFLTGLMVTIGMLGAIFGQAPLALLIEHFGWRDSLIALGIIGLVLAGFIYTIAKDKPAGYVDHPHEDEAPLLKSLANLLKNPQLWLIAIYGGLMYMATPVFCGLWGVPFLMTKLSISKTLAANYISLVFIGWAIGSPLWGIYSNRIGLRKPPLYIASLGALCTILLFIYAPVGTSFLMQILLFIFGIFSSGFLPSFSVAKERCNPRYVATGLSFMNMMNMIGVAVAQPLVGFILDKFWTGHLTHHGVRVYNAHAYHIALGILPLGIFIALCLLPFIEETYCRIVPRVTG